MTAPLLDVGPIPIKVKPPKVHQPRKERDDTPWWWPFGQRTIWCPAKVGDGHFCDMPSEVPEHWAHTCVCGFRWAA